MNNVSVKMHEPVDVEENLKFEINRRNKSVILRAQNFKTEMKGNFTFRFLMMDIVGVAFSNASDVQMTIETELGTQIDSKTGERAPSLKVKEVQIKVDPKKIVVRLEGSLVAKIASLFTDLFKTQILG